MNSPESKELLSISVLAVLSHRIETHNVLDLARLVRILGDLFPDFLFLDVLLACILFLLLEFDLLLLPLYLLLELLCSSSLLVDEVDNCLVECMLEEA